MKNILEASHVDEFAGSFVAIKVTLPSYFGRKEKFPIVGDDGLLFALIAKSKSYWQGGETGYDMSELLISGAVPSFNALIGSTLSNVTMKMRLATADELAAIKELVETKEAHFEYKSPQDIIPKIEKAIADLESSSGLSMRY